MTRPIAAGQVWPDWAAWCRHWLDIVQAEANAVRLDRAEAKWICEALSEAEAAWRAGDGEAMAAGLDAVHGYVRLKERVS